MRVAYADPPYIGCSSLYKNEPEYCGEINHQTLIRELSHYDGWALSCTSNSLGELLTYAPGARVAAWVKPFSSWKPNVTPSYAWEPVIFKPVNRPEQKADKVRDWIAASITLQKGLTGAKPARFCMWLFDLLNMTPDDDFFDLYPGTGIVTECHDYWKMKHTSSQLTLDIQAYTD